MDGITCCQNNLMNSIVYILSHYMSFTGLIFKALRAMLTKYLNLEAK